MWSLLNKIWSANPIVLFIGGTVTIGLIVALIWRAV